MKALKLATLPVALLATSAYANDVVVEEATYDPQAGIIQNSTTQVVDGAKTFFKKATNPGAISLEAGTLGYGGNIAWGVSEKAEVVVGWNGGKLDKTFDDLDYDFDDNSYKGNVDLNLDYNNPYVGLQLRPFANWLTVGTGVLFNDNSDNTASVTLKPQGSTEISFKNKKYTLNEGSSLKMTIDHRNDLAPYLTLGFRPNINSRWGIYGEIGAAYLGKTRADVEATGSIDNAQLTRLKALGTATAERIAQEEAKVRADIEKTAKSKIEGQAWSDWYPIAKVGVTVRF